VITGVLLAAGAGTRFGPHSKLLHPLADGTPVAVAAATSLVAGVDRGVAVVRPGQAELARRLSASGLEVVVVPAAERGMGASLAAGVAASEGATGWVIALADMPWIAPATVAGVAGALRDGAPLAAPCHAGRGGHPVGFAAELGPALRGLDGDTGARPVVAAHREQLVTIPVEDPGIHRDLDRPEDGEGVTTD
jgi:molybdenum cofactor cytidylyltransferase